MHVVMVMYLLSNIVFAYYSPTKVKIQDNI